MGSPSSPSECACPHGANRLQEKRRAPNHGVKVILLVRQRKEQEQPV